MTHSSLQQWLVVLFIASVLSIGCGKSGPSRSGEVWEIDPAGGRNTAPAAVLAYVNGLHLVVVDGDHVYGGTTELKTEPAAQGGRTVVLANGLTATLTPAGADRMDLRFSSGESIAMHKKQVKEMAKR